MSTGCIIPQNAVDDFKMILWDGMLGGNRLLDFSDGSSHDVYPGIFDGFSSLRDSAIVSRDQQLWRRFSVFF